MNPDSNCIVLNPEILKNGLVVNRKEYQTVNMRNCLVLLIIFLPALCVGGPANVTDVVTECSNRLCRFQVTVQHDDEGWEHYANAILVLTEDEKVLGHRPLRHPHVGEKSFTRTVQALIPEDIDTVLIRASDTLHGTGGKTMNVSIRPGSPKK